MNQHRSKTRKTEAAAAAVTISITIISTVHDDQKQQQQ